MLVYLLKKKMVVFYIVNIDKACTFVFQGGWQHVSIRGCMEDLIVPALSI